MRIARAAGSWAVFTRKCIAVLRKTEKSLLAWFVIPFCILDMSE
jgi:hypothetical protein